jgi:hypothetical protein
MTPLKNYAAQNGLFFTTLLSAVALVIVHDYLSLHPEIVKGKIGAETCVVSSKQTKSVGEITRVSHRKWILLFFWVIFGYNVTYQLSGITILLNRELPQTPTFQRFSPIPALSSHLQGSRNTPPFRAGFREFPHLYPHLEISGLGAHVTLGGGPKTARNFTHLHPKPTKYVPFWAKFDALYTNDCRLPQLRNAPLV